MNALAGFPTHPRQQQSLGLGGVGGEVGEERR
jgi:hypothetical protein